VGYFNDYQNLTGECTMSSGCDSDNLGRQYNGGRVSIYGLESVGGLTIPLSPGVSLPIEATYTLTESQFQTDFVSGLSQFGSVQQGDSLPYVARHSASFRAGLETKRLTLSAGVSYRSQLLDSAGSFTDDDEVLLPELLLIDAGGNLALTDGWSLYMTGTNLTNTTAVTSWRPWGARPSAPLQVMAGIKWRPQP
jgi:Fe(3+) dicitrate transport protein